MRSAQHNTVLVPINSNVNQNDFFFVREKKFTMRFYCTGMSAPLQSTQRFIRRPIQVNSLNYLSVIEIPYQWFHDECEIKFSDYMHQYECVQNIQRLFHLEHCNEDIPVVEAVPSPSVLKAARDYVTQIGNKHGYELA